MLDAGIVSNALFEFRRWGEARNPGGVTAISTSSTFLREAEDWMIGPHLAGILERAQIPPPPMANGVLYPSSPEVAMFGTLTPDLVERDALILLETLARARCTHADPPVLSALVEDIAPPTRETSWSQGYDCALRTLDGIEVTPQHFVDVEQILCSLEIAIESRSISDASLRGVAIAGIGFRPTIVINEFCEKNKTAPGRRFTLAHELCHILFDRDRARRVTHSSPPWAPEPIERRANAFAAMFLMPYRLIDAALAEVGPITTSSKLNRLAQRLRCGRRALLEHLKNIDRIDQAVFYRLSMAH